MKSIKLFLLFVAACLAWSCSEESLDSNSIFDTTAVQRQAFDQWILENYVQTYNLDFKYKLDDKESDMEYNLVPADLDKSIAMAKLTKFLWFEAYEELFKGNTDFIRSYCPRLIHLIGSPAYNTQGSVVLGTAEGGVKVTLYNINLLDPEDIDIEELNYWFFKTMHHEFAHILHQNKNYTTDFNLISSNYQSASWVNLDPADALTMGFISSYASNEPREDFVELISIYVTHDAAYWESQLKAAGVNGRALIEAKFAIVKEYLATSWEIDIDLLRSIVLRRSAEAKLLDLSTLN